MSRVRTQTSSTGSVGHLLLAGRAFQDSLQPALFSSADSVVDSLSAIFWLRAYNTLIDFRYQCEQGKISIADESRYCCFSSTLYR
jgi:hypothetical protein